MPLTAEEKAKVLSALNGNKNYLAVQYKFSLPVTASLEISIDGDVTPDIKKLTKTAADEEKSPSILGKFIGRSNRKQQQQDKTISLEDCLAQIEMALSEQRLTLTLKEINQVSNELRKTVNAEVKKYAANQLLSRVKGVKKQDTIPKQSRLNATAKQTEIKQYSGDCVTDVSSWFPDANGSDYIQISPTTIEEPARVSSSLTNANGTEK